MTDAVGFAPRYDNDRSQATDALATRHRLNAQRGSLDLVAWLGSRLKLEPGSRWLDLGCGRGDQLVRLGASTPGIARLVGMDISAGSLGALRDAARARGLEVEAIEGEMELLAQVEALPSLTGLTHITSVYALYYAEQLRALMAGMRRRLVPGGRVVVVGPAPGNNAEWFGLLRDAGVRLPARIVRVSEGFVYGELVPAAEASGFGVAVEETSNPVVIPSAAELVAYWRSNIYHDPARDAEVVRAIERWFDRSPAFTITKKIALVTLEVPA